MDLQLRQVQRLELVQIQLAIRLEQRLELYIPEEFKRYINLEEDDDRELLAASLPFLALHEFSHPLHAKGKIHIPLLPYAGHNALETGIDKAAMLLGPHIEKYLPEWVRLHEEQMYLSHYAMMQRVFRDHFTHRRFKTDIPFIARLYCEIREHKEQTQNDTLKKQLEELIKTADHVISDKNNFNALIAEYTQIYKGTTLRE